jgi:hypothetical protein
MANYFTTCDSNIFSSQMHELFTNQSLKGWNHIIMGRFTKTWLPLLSSYYCSPINWVAYITKTLWTHVYKVWKIRCNKNHGESAQSVRKQAINFTYTHNYIIMGRFSKTWLPLLSSYCSSPINWVAFVTKTLWTHVYKIWKIRCNKNHGESAQSVRIQAINVTYNDNSSIMCINGFVLVVDLNYIL